MRFWVEQLNERWESVVLLFAADALAVIDAIGLVVEVELVEAIGEGHQYQTVDEKELEDV